MLTPNLSSPTPLQKHLEDYLSQEGLYSIFPEHRSKSLFTIPVIRVGLVLLLLIEIVMLSGFRQSLQIIPATVITFISIVIAFFTGFICMLIQYARTKKSPDQSQAALFGRLVLIFLLTSVALLNAYHYQSLILGLISIIVLFFGLALFTLLYNFYHRIYGLLGALRSILYSAIRSAQLSLAILPLMLILTLFSVFSGELWQVLGGIETSRLFLGIGFLFAPALILLATSLGKVSQQITQKAEGEFFSAELVASTPVMKTQLNKGTIAIKEWRDAESQLEWMHKEPLLEETAFVEKRTTRTWIQLLLFTTTFALCIFTVYFYFLFRILINYSQIEEWTGIPLESVSIDLPLLSQSVSVGTTSIDIALGKVSIFLAAFVAIVILVQSLTDETFREIFTEELSRRSRTWVSACVLYKAVLMPGYQLWSIIHNPRAPAVVHVIVVVKSPSSDEEVRKACEHVQASNIVSKYNTLRVIAFEKKEHGTDYGIGIPGRKWVYNYNALNKKDGFYENHSVDPDTPATDHELGDKCLEEGNAIPDAWFSEQDDGIKIGKLLWATEEYRRDILHPRITIGKDTIVAHVHLRRRLQTSGDYRLIMRKVYITIKSSNATLSSLLLTLAFRTSLERLATLDYNEIAVSYRDEVVNKTELYSQDEWENTSKKWL